MMRWPFPEGARVTAGFAQPRPLSAPPARRRHIHGAIDVAAPVGAPITAPEPGMLHYWAAFRPDVGRGMEEVAGVDFPFSWQGRPYFYDVYGGVVVLLGASGLTHVWAHSFMNQLFNRPPHRLRWVYEESPAVERFPVSAWYTTNGLGHHVRAGERIGAVGNAGFSTGPHSHYEIHRGRVWQEHSARPNPEEIYNISVGGNRHE